MKRIWECKIGEADLSRLPDGADAPMRNAVQEAYYKLTGKGADFCFSGWAGELTDTERSVVAKDFTKE